jgi:hypothetical protein
MVIIKGLDNSVIHIQKHSVLDKYIILVEKQISEGFAKSFKLIADNFESYENDTHSFEISGAHYSVTPNMDFLPMVNRILNSRSYRLYKQRVVA